MAICSFGIDSRLMQCWHGFENPRLVDEAETNLGIKKAVREACGKGKYSRQDLTMTW